MIDFSMLILAALLLSLTLPVFGSIILWDERSFLADTISHSTIFGAALGFVFPLPDYIILFLVALGVTFLSLLKPKRIPKDAWLIFISATFMAIGNLIFEMYPTHDNVLHDLFFGDIFLLNTKGLFILGVCCCLGLAHLYAMWPYILTLILNEEMAVIDGHPKTVMKVIFNIFIALIITASIKYIGVMLLSAFLVLPAVVAQQVSKSPKQMIYISVAVAAAGSFMGLLGVAVRGLPFSSVITISFALLFVVSMFTSKDKP